MSLRMKIVNTFLRYTIKPILKYAPFNKDVIWVTRSAVNAMTHVGIRPDAKITQVRVSNTLLGEWVETKPRVDKSKTRVCLYLHGGGYIACSPSSHRTITSYIARRANCSVLAIDYRKAPEDRYPCALQDARMTYKYLLLCGYKAENIVIAGDSAGGNLTLVLTRDIIDAGLPRPAAIVAISPWCDLSGASAITSNLDKIDPMLPAERISEAGSIYAGNGIGLKDPLLSPRWQSFKGFPPTMFAYGELEILRDEIEQTFTKLQDESESESKIVRTQGCPHVFQLFVGVVPESKQSLKEICQFFDKHLNTPNTDV